MSVVRCREVIRWWWSGRDVTILPAHSAMEGSVCKRHTTAMSAAGAGEWRPERSLREVHPLTIDHRRVHGAQKAGHQQIDRFAVGRCGYCGCCGDSQQVSPTDIPPSPTARSQQPSTCSQHHRASVENHFVVTPWTMFE